MRQQVVGRRGLSGGTVAVALLAGLLAEPSCGGQGNEARSSWVGVPAGRHGGGSGTLASTCDWSAPPPTVAEWVDESWHAALSRNVVAERGWLLDAVMLGRGTLNLCVRWGASAPLTKDVQDRIVPSMTAWFSDWFKALGSYGCFPYPDGVTVQLAGIAVRDAALVEVPDGRVPIYTELDGASEPPGEPTCPSSCSFLNNWSHVFPNCPGGHANHFDYEVWIDDRIPGEGVLGYGSSWGLRMPYEGFLAVLGGRSHTVEHEMGHAFGMQDYYDWQGATPEGGSLMIVGSSSRQQPTVGDAWPLRRIWKEQRALRGW